MRPHCHPLLQVTGCIQNPAGMKTGHVHCQGMSGTRSLQKGPFSLGGNVDLHLIHDPLGPLKSTSKRHLHQFSRIAGLTVVSSLIIITSHYSNGSTRLHRPHLNCTFCLGIQGSPHIVHFFRPPLVHNPNVI